MNTSTTPCAQELHFSSGWSLQPLPEPAQRSCSPPVPLPLGYIPCSSFPLGWHQLPSSATSDQTTRWTLGLTDSTILSNAVQIAQDCAGVGKSPACITLNYQLIPPCRATLLCCPLTDNFKEPLVHAKTSISRLLNLRKDPAIMVR